MQGDAIFAKLRVSGTKNEELIRCLSGKSEKVVNIHLCEEGCAQQISDELLLHAPGFEEIDLARLPWLTNLQGKLDTGEEADELADLRREQARMDAEVADKTKEVDKKDKKHKKRKERSQGREGFSPKKERDDLEAGKSPLRTSSGSLGWIQIPPGGPRCCGRRGKSERKEQRRAKERQRLIFIQEIQILYIQHKHFKRLWNGKSL